LGVNLFYAPNLSQSDSTVVLPADEAMHAVKVLRTKVGYTVYVTDGLGSFFETTVISVGKKDVQLRVDSRRFVPREQLPVLAVGMIKSRERLEWLVEKSVELGVSKLILMQTERSERSHVREDRLRAIQVSAMKQCLTSWLPELVTGMPFEAVLDEGKLANQPMYIAHEKAAPESRMPHTDTPDAPLLLVGPEGGFSDREVQLALDAGATMVSLGSRRLRAETAALALLSRVVSSK
jgi:16S rRNA (uracil1498-N3)-methyltransferase